MEERPGASQGRERRVLAHARTHVQAERRRFGAGHAGAVAAGSSSAEGEQA